MKLYIHMGQHKTGTTGLQQFCSRYRRKLIEQFDLCYPTPPIGPKHRHRGLFPFQRHHWEQVRDEVQRSQCSRVLISSEHLSTEGLDDDDLRKIRECFAGYEIFLVVYLRRIDDYCRSWYNQRLKNGHRAGGDYATFLKELERDSLNLRPSELLRKCERQAGRDHLLVRLYDPCALKNNNTVDDFFDLLGIELPTRMARTRRNNPSLPDELLPYITQSLRHAPAHDPVAADMRRKLAHAFAMAEEGMHVDVRLASRLQKEINAVDAYLPGYRGLYAERGLDLTFPSLRADPCNLIMLDLMYSIFFELRRRQSFVAGVKQRAARLVRAAARKIPALERVVSRLLPWKKY